MWSSILRYSTTSYLSHSISTVLTLHMIKEQSTQSIVVTSFLGLFVLLWPFVIYKILKANDSQLSHPLIKQQIGTLYTNYETNKASVFHFTAFFLYRRLLFAALLKAPLFLQISVLCFTSIAMLLYLIKWQPFESNLYDFAAIMNECVFWVSGYLMIGFQQGFVQDPELRHQIGAWFLQLIYVDFAVNLAMLIFESFGVIRKSFRMWRLKRQQK